MAGYDYRHSEKIFRYLDKAIELDSNYGNARYFYGAECSANAFRAMQNYDVQEVKSYYKKAYRESAYPPWLLEFGRNMLMSCRENAVLFAGGNADFDVCAYLILHENFRTDITLIPIGNIDRPRYVKLLKKGLPEFMPPIRLSLSDNQIEDMHPYKWRESEIAVPVSKSTAEEFGQPVDSFTVNVKPDLHSERMHSKIKEESGKARSFLSPQRAVLIQIVEDNYSERPIYFSGTANPYFYEPFGTMLKNSGLVFRLMPGETSDTPHRYDYRGFEKLIRAENLKDYKTILHSDIPRISQITQSYFEPAIRLAAKYRQTDKEKYERLMKIIEENLFIGRDSEREERLRKYLEQLGE